MGCRGYKGVISYKSDVLGFAASIQPTGYVRVIRRFVGG